MTMGNCYRSIMLFSMARLVDFETIRHCEVVLLTC